MTDLSKLHFGNLQTDKLDLNSDLEKAFGDMRRSITASKKEHSIQD